MSALAYKRILLGVTGGIAAYKACELTRLLKKSGAEVRVVMTRAATEFVTPLTFQALSGEAVRTDLFDTAAEAGMGHIELARWADAVLVAPASADFMARLAAGMANDLLATLCLATEAPVLVAPAMNRVMWDHPATQANREILLAQGVQMLGPGSGAQACGEQGEGRMQEPDELVTQLEEVFHTGELGGKKVVITAGPTREALDPVRYLSNYSSGKMGFALARAAHEAGADVILVAGPVNLPTPEGVRRVDVQDALEMRAAVMQHIEGCDLFIAAAAVADYRPIQRAPQKLKKNTDTLTVELARNPDILAEVAVRTSRPYVVGFAAETEHLLEHAQEKLRRKRPDMLIANRVGHGLGFDQDDNALEVIWPGGQQSFPRASKQRLARDLVRLIAERMRNGRAPHLTLAT
ncbi:MAG: bifunctional phosphopantothenoylcysteine decarboxylase/phosphopantothenate--cysteine ligase CoaBC [Gammaproteobacteria bacterium]